MFRESIKGISGWPLNGPVEKGKELRGEPSKSPTLLKYKTVAF